MDRSHLEQAFNDISMPEGANGGIRFPPILSMEKESWNQRDSDSFEDRGIESRIIFLRFLTFSTSLNGTGLGLSITKYCRATWRQDRGRKSVQVGTKFTITLPVMK
jgi:hypothetical protein